MQDALIVLCDSDLTEDVLVRAFRTVRCCFDLEDKFFRLRSDLKRFRCHFVRQPHQGHCGRSFQFLQNLNFNHHVRFFALFHG